MGVGDVLHMMVMEPFTMPALSAGLQTPQGDETGDSRPPLPVMRTSSSIPPVLTASGCPPPPPPPPLLGSSSCMPQ
ncbi:hypothetical protein MUK42_36313 [Musa troglodytarum]|uniref:Uncharacterized protein n=1 Tax=Musa troglodytarum TaxID=320322 RepID=A0A9E7J8H1_9LILI|nr:hypothetical protein MUK42_36313 [Musa troglodytarum]